MKKTLFKIINKGQILFFFLAMTLALSSTLALGIASAKETNITGDRLDFTVVVDPGHGGIDPGSIGYKTKVKESEINLKIAKVLKDKLTSVGIRVVMTRETDDGLYGLSTQNYKKRDMQRRREIIEEVRPDIVVSVHQNSYCRHNLRGAQVFYDKSSERSENLALLIQDQFAARLEKSDKGVAVGDYYMLKCTEAASVIAECGFLSNEEDEKLLLSEEYQETIADCILSGIVNFLNAE